MNWRLASENREGGDLGLGGKTAENGGFFARKAVALTGGGFFTLKLIRLMLYLDCLRFGGQRSRVAFGQ